MTTLNYQFEGALTNNGDGTFTVNTPDTSQGPVTTTFDGTLTPGTSFTWQDHNGASHSGVFDGTDANGDLIYHDGGSYQILTNTLYDNGQTLTSVAGGLVCFLAGALIATPDGERLVESLRIGDRVVTVTGEAKPIVWVGSGRERLQPWDKKPVIVRAGALADGLPRRDLRLTEGHSLFLDGVLIPVSSLLNGRSILWDEEAVNVEYYHIEVEGHDVVLAEGAPAETYRNDGNRKFFLAGAVGLDHRLASADEVPPYAPIFAEGPDVDRVWRRLSDRAGVVPTCGEADIHLLVDGERVDPEEVSGDRYRFSLSQEPRQVRLASATFRPSDIGTVRDIRMLGIAVRALTLRGADGDHIHRTSFPFADGGMARRRAGVSLDHRRRQDSACRRWLRAFHDRGRGCDDRDISATCEGASRGFPELPRQRRLSCGTGVRGPGFGPPSIGIRITLTARLYLFASASATSPLSLPPCSRGRSD